MKKMSWAHRTLLLRRAMSTSAPYGQRERLAEKYLAQREWTVERLLESRRLLKENTDFSKQLAVNWVDQSSPVAKAVDDMVVKDIGSLLVCSDINGEKRKFMGIITERDLMRKVMGKRLNPDEVTCKQVMTPRKNLSVVTLDHTLYECLHLFEKGEFRHLPVVSLRGDLGPEEEDVVAVLSQRDLVHEFRVFHEANLQYIESFVDFPIW